MGFDLTGDGGYFRCSGAGWADLLQLAVDYGWQPIGTGPPRGTLKQDWPGIYHSNEGQLVYARDANQLADALNRFLNDTPKPAKTMKRERTKGSESYFLTSGGRDYLGEFITFCRSGSSRLH